MIKGSEKRIADHPIDPLHYELWQNREDATKFTFVDEWESEATLDARAANQHLKEAADILEGLIKQAPDVRRYSPVL